MCQARVFLSDHCNHTVIEIIVSMKRRKKNRRRRIV